MKKTITINISGSVFTIEEEAYLSLERYLSDIKKRMGGPDEAQETLADIEFRIAELFRMTCPTPNETVTVQMVDEMVRVMGKPNEFGDEMDAEPTAGPGTSQPGAAGSVGVPISKRLYRDPSNKVIAGVCGGLGAYFNIDPIIVRILFVVMVLSGISVLLYIGLWIAMPEAFTLTQRMEMMGYAGSVPRNDNLSGFAQQTKYGSNSLSGTIETVVSGLGRALAVLVGFVLVMVSFVLLSAFFAALFFGHYIDSSFINVVQLGHEMFPINTFYLLLTALIALIGIPLLSIFYLGIRLLFNLPMLNKWIGVTAFVIWLAAFVVGIVSVVKLSGQIGNKTYERSRYTLAVGNSKKLYLEPSDVGMEHFHRNKRMKINNKTIYWQNGELVSVLKPSIYVIKGDSCRISIERESNSPLLDEHHWMSSLPDVYRMPNDSVITINPSILIPTEETWFLQKVTVTLEIPDGYSLNINPLIRDLVEIDQR